MDDLSRRPERRDRIHHSRLTEVGVLYEGLMLEHSPVAPRDEDLTRSAGIDGDVEVEGSHLCPPSGNQRRPPHGAWHE
jgi:hypothetical protein